MIEKWPIVSKPHREINLVTCMLFQERCFKCQQRIEANTDEKMIQIYMYICIMYVDDK